MRANESDRQKTENKMKMEQDLSRSVVSTAKGSTAKGCQFWKVKNKGVVKNVADGQLPIF